jgi:hypothetical protein
LEDYVGKYFLEREVILVLSRDDQNFRSSMISNSSMAIATTWDWGSLYRWLPLPRPASAVSEVRLGIWGADDVILTEGVDYDLELKGPFARVRITNWNIFYFTVSYLQITFTSGYGPLATDVPKAIHQAIRLMTVRMKENFGDRNFDLYIDAIESLIGPYKTFVLGGGSQYV